MIVAVILEQLPFMEHFLCAGRWAVYVLHPTALSPDLHAVNRTPHSVDEETDAQRPQAGGLYSTDPMSLAPPGPQAWLASVPILS